MSAGPSRAGVIAAFAAIYVFWSGSFLAIRWAVADVPPFLVIGLRCLGGAAVLFAWLVWRGALQRATGREWLTAAIAGATLFVGCHGVLAWAERRVPSGEAALYMTSIPLWLVALTALRERRSPAIRMIAGVCLGILGIVILTGGQVRDGALVARLALIGAGFAWAAGSLVARDGARPPSSVQSTAMQLLAGGIAVLVASVVLGEPAAWSPAMLTTRSLMALGYLIICGTALGFGAYTWLLRVSSPAAVGTYAYVNPAGALLLGWLLGDGSPMLRTLIAAPLVVAAVVLSRSPLPPAAKNATSRWKMVSRDRPASAIVSHRAR